MDFTMNMMDSGRGGIPATQAAALAAIQGTAYQAVAHQAHQTTHQGHQANHHTTAHLISVTPTHQQQSQQHPAAVANQQHQQEQHPHHQQQQPQHHPQQMQQHNSLHEEDTNGAIVPDTKPQEITKDESEGAFTPPPRVGSVGSVASHPDTRVEKGTDTNDFEPLIKVEIRGHIPGLTGPEKDKPSIVQLHFNSVNEVLHYFSQRSVPQLDAFNLLTNPDLVRNINPDIVRNHFLYVPNSQDGVRVASNGFTTANAGQVAQTQAAAPTPIVIAGAPIPAVTQNHKVRPIKTERRRGEVPPGTIINKTPPIEANPNQFMCWICGLNLQKSLPFEEHMVEQHSIEKPYRCEDCGVTFKQKAHIDRHRRIHLPTRPYQCGVCGKGFTRNEHVRRHSFTHSGEKPYHCPTCSKTFSRQQQLTKHMLTHTKPPRPDSPQPGHPHGLTTTLLLQATDQNGHLVTINQPGQAVAVPSTGVGASHLVSQTTHTSGRGRQPNGEPVARPYRCGVCGKAFIRNEHLRRHMLIHSGEKPHVCGSCGKAFPRREHLTKHMRSHIKDNPQAQQSSPLTSAQSHSGLQAAAGTVVSNVTSQVSLPVAAHTTVTSGVPTGVSVVTSGHQPAAAHTGPATHTVHASHATPVTHAASLAPGTHYLPMFSLLAEVV